MLIKDYYRLRKMEYVKWFIDINQGNDLQIKKRILNIRENL